MGEDQFRPLLQQQQDSQVQTVHELRLLQQQMGGQRDEVQTEFGAALRALCAQLDRRQEQLQDSMSAELARVHDADNNVGRLRLDCEAQFSSQDATAARVREDIAVLSRAVADVQVMTENMHHEAKQNNRGTLEALASLKGELGASRATERDMTATTPMITQDDNAKQQQLVISQQRQMIELQQLLQFLDVHNSGKR